MKYNKYKTLEYISIAFSYPNYQSSSQQPQPQQQQQQQQITINSASEYNNE